MSWPKLYTRYFSRSYYPHPNGAGLGDAARVKQYRAVAFLTGTHPSRTTNKPNICIVCMDAQPVRVIVRFPYNRPEHLQAELVSGTPSVSGYSSQGPTQ